MVRMQRAALLTFSLCCLLFLSGNAQSIRTLRLDTARGIIVAGYTSADGVVTMPATVSPLFTCRLNDTLLTAASVDARWEGDSVVWHTPRGLEGSVCSLRIFSGGWKAIVTFRNSSADTLQLSEVVPLGEGPDRVFIRAAGPSTYQVRLSRSALFRPGLGPIGVVLPDNAWEMGFCDVPVDRGRGLTAIARRTGSGNADMRRFRTGLRPGGWVQYEIHADDHAGDWRAGLRMMLQERWLYDLETFDNSLFQRPDLAWIRRSYLLLLQFAWDREYYDALTGRYGFDQFLSRWSPLVGGFEAYMLWPTWPRLGLDPRNQWDMYRDLPGGMAELRRQVQFARSHGTRFFIAYNPWDESTRKEDHLDGMERMLRDLQADGVVLDTWGQSSRDFQAAADRVKPGVILYSEGMAVPADMPGIVAGRVHDAIYMTPPLNLNRLIKPDFAIFRVLQLAEGRLHREIGVSFFNGHGVELNIMRPGRPDWVEDELRTLGRTTMILRQNPSAFVSPDWVPLLPTTVDSIWVNNWPANEKTLFTVYSLRPEGHSGPLFEAPVPEGSHVVDLWHHEEVGQVTHEGRHFLPATVDGFSRSWLGSRREGNVDCLAVLPRLLEVTLDGDSLTVKSRREGKIIVWAGSPSYSCPSAELPRGTPAISLRAMLGRHEEKFVVQLLDSTELLDERVVHVPLATPRLIGRPIMTRPASAPPAGMVEIPAGSFVYNPTRSFLSPNEVIPYPGSSSRGVTLPRFYMDRYPVTNAQFRQFTDATGYTPADTTNFLKHWRGGRPPRGEENHPVVYIDRLDAEAYARWAQKRLPTEMEWQYAAQGSDGRKYPWGDEYDSTRCNHALGHTTPVDAFPRGASPFGVMDMVGNVWQLTGDLYDNGTFLFLMIRGGSHFKPSSSWWYVQGGPQPVDNPQILLLVGPGLNRCSTVGFRCVRDAVATLGR